MKSSKKALAFALAAAMAITGVPVTNAGAATTTAKLGATKATIYAGNSKYISVSTPSSWKSVKLSVSSSKTSVASVKKNNAKKKIRVDAVKAGTAKVTVKVTAKKSGKTVKKTLSANITVKDYKVRLVDAAGTTVSNTTIDTTVGTAVKLTAKTAPANDKVTFTSSDESVATVDASGNVTPVKAGTVTITAASAKASDKVTVIVSDAVADGITASLVSHIDGQEHAVLVTENATVKVTLTKDGKPVANKQVIMTAIANNCNNTNADYALLSSNYAVTDTNGIASFVIGNKKTVTSATDTNAVGEVKYTVATADNSMNTVSDVVTFAAINYGKIEYKNGTDAKYKGKVPGTNYKLANGSSNGSALTKSVNKSQDDVTFVASQQVSTAGTKDHEVTFEAVPSLVIPNSSSSTQTTKEFKQDITDGTSGEYNTYDSKTKIVEVKTDVSNLDYATLYIKNIQISKYCKLEISAFTSKADAEKNQNAVPGSVQTIPGEREQSSFGYQIPKNGTVKYIRVSVVSKGQVNVNKNDGFVLDRIEGMYKTSTAGNVTSVIGGVNVTWESADAITYSEDKSLTANQASRLGIPSNNNGTPKTNYTYVYQVPTFPQAGNAIIREYDAAKKLKAYYAIPAVNMVDNAGKSVNENDIYTVKGGTALVSATKAFLITEEEAKNIVGTVEQDGNLVKVNSEKVGTTKLVGTVKIAGTADSNESVENGKIYTSVAWSPLPKDTATATSNSVAFVAVKGQTVKVNAQITDKNGNPVAQQGAQIKFSYAGGDIVKKGTLTSTVNKRANVTYLPSATDVYGRCELTVQAADVDTVTNLKATVVGTYAGKYDVKLVVKDKTVDQADIYWVDAALAYTPSAVEYNDEPDIQLTYTSRSKTIPTSKPNAGEKWEYGVYVTSSTLVDGILGGCTASINGLKTKYTISGMTNGVTVTSAKDGASAVLESSKGGLTKLKAALDTTALNDNATVTVTDANGNVKDAVFAGTGSVNIFDTITIPVQWESTGVTASWVNPYSTKSAANRTVFLKVVDSKGNALSGKTVKFTNTVETSATTNSDGIAKATVNKPIDIATTPSTIVTAEVAGITETFSTTVNWTNSNVDLQPVQAVYAQGTPDTITVTFNKDVDAASVTAKEFTVNTGSGDDLAKYTVANTSVNGNKVVLTLAGSNVLSGKSATFTVTVGKATIDSVDYNILAEDGSALSDTNKAITFASDADDELALEEKNAGKITVTVPKTTVTRDAYIVDENGNIKKVIITANGTTAESTALTAGGYYIVYYGNVAKDITLNR